VRLCARAISLLQPLAVIDRTPVACHASLLESSCCCLILSLLCGVPHACDTSAVRVCRRAIILLESNLGMSELEEMLTQLGDRSKVRHWQR
jgi:hypothetical protein